MLQVMYLDCVDISHAFWLVCNFSFMNMKYKHYPDNVNVNLPAGTLLFEKRVVAHCTFYNNPNML